MAQEPGQGPAIGRNAHRILALLTLGPILLWALAFGAVLFLSAVLGCSINEGFAAPCLLLGRDISDTAYALGLFAAWGPLVFAPFVMGAGLSWAILALIGALRKRKS
ncbi:hypothetical protein AAFO90_12560 [Phaeobacter sp. CAU 1743]|uniref:hypothetical protein n=1 Tax=Phaeobacter sp. CAU 1743 TaxID=3140367 RepID=UPI0023B5FF2F